MNEALYDTPTVYELETVCYVWKSKSCSGELLQLHCQFGRTTNCGTTDVQIIRANSSTSFKLSNQAIHDEIAWVGSIDGLKFCNQPF